MLPKQVEAVKAVSGVTVKPTLPRTVLTAMYDRVRDDDCQADATACGTDREYDRVCDDEGQADATAYGTDRDAIRY